MTLLGIADVATGCVLAGAGTVILFRRPRHRVGLLFLLVATGWFLGNVSGHLIFLHRGPMVHAHLSYPTGRVRRWWAALAVVAAYGWAFAEGWTHRPGITAVVAVAVAAAAIDGHLHTGGPARRADRPALAAALLFAAVLALSAANQIGHWSADYAVAVTYDAVLALVAAWLTFDLLRGRWTEATLAELVSEMGEHESGADLVSQLRRAVGDPSLTIEYPAAAQVHDGRARTEVVDGGRLIATVVHDPALMDDPELLVGAVSAARVAMTNAQLREDIAARAATLAAARRRLVEAGDEQRRRVQAELAAGADADLARAGELLAEATATRPELGELAATVAAARAELRRFAEGVRPEALEAGGLAAALPELARRVAIPATVTVEVPRVAPAVESAAYFVCSEALANATKHASASHVTVEARCADDVLTVRVVDNGVGGADASGTGLTGLADRVAALGGNLVVTSELGHGTVIAAHIPLGAGR